MELRIDIPLLKLNDHNKILLHCVCLQMLCWSRFLVPKRVSQCYWHTKILCFEENVLKIQQMWQFFARLTKNGKFLFCSGGLFEAKMLK